VQDFVKARYKQAFSFETGHFWPV